MPRTESSISTSLQLPNSQRVQKSRAGVDQGWCFKNISVPFPAAAARGIARFIGLVSVATASCFSGVARNDSRLPGILFPRCAAFPIKRRRRRTVPPRRGFNSCTRLHGNCFSSRTVRLLSCFVLCRRDFGKRGLLPFLHFENKELQKNCANKETLYARRGIAREGRTLLRRISLEHSSNSFTLPYASHSCLEACVRD